MSELTDEQKDLLDEIYTRIFERRIVKDQDSTVRFLLMIGQYFAGQAELPEYVKLRLAQGFMESAESFKTKPLKDARKDLISFLGADGGSKKEINDVVYKKVISEL